MNLDYTCSLLFIGPPVIDVDNLEDGSICDECQHEQPLLFNRVTTPWLLYALTTTLAGHLGACHKGRKITKEGKGKHFVLS